MASLDQRLRSFIEPRNDAELNQREWILIGLTLIFAGLVVVVSPWFLMPAIMGAIAHRSIVDDQMRRGSRRGALERLGEEVEALVVATVNERFDTEGMDPLERDLRFSIEKLYLRRGEEGGVLARAEVVRDDGTRYRVRLFVPREDSTREPDVEVTPILETDP